MGLISTKFKFFLAFLSAFLVSQTVLAESQIAGIATGLTAEIDGAKTVVLSLFGAGLVILGLFAGYRYLKRGANSA